MFALIRVCAYGKNLPMPNALLEVSDLSISGIFLRSTEKIVEGVSFTLLEGEKIAIVGESGSGKSMILNALTSSLPSNCYAEGAIRFNGIDLLSQTKDAKKLLGKEIVYVPQGGAESLNPSLRIRTQMMEIFKADKRKLSKKEKEDICLSSLQKVGLEGATEIFNKYPFEISGGEAQRVLLAIALASSPKLLVVDEATRGIDKENSDLFWDCLDGSFSSVSILLVTHDLNEAKKCGKIIVLKDGKVEASGYRDEVFGSNANPYIKSLISDYEGEYA